MGRGRAVYKVFEITPEGRIRMGRPRLVWLRDTEKDFWKMKIKKIAAEGSKQSIIKVKVTLEQAMKAQRGSRV